MPDVPAPVAQADDEERKSVTGIRSSSSPSESFSDLVLFFFLWLLKIVTQGSDVNLSAES
jgi:hypothetical protein